MNSTDLLKSLYDLEKQLSKLIENLESETMINQDGVLLKIPWLSQLGATAAYAPGDCGAACLAMWLGWLGQSVTVDAVSRLTGKSAGFLYLSFEDLGKVAKQYQLTLKHEVNTLSSLILSELNAQRPLIALIDYQKLPIHNRFDPSYAAGHLVLLVGYDGQHLFYHDPYWPNAGLGQNRTLLWEEFDLVFSSVTKGNSYARQIARQV